MLFDTRRLAIPLLLTAGRGDGMGGLAGLEWYAAAATGGPVLSVVAEGATHCHVYIPVGSECGLPGVVRPLTLPCSCIPLPRLKCLRAAFTEVYTVLA